MKLTMQDMDSELLDEALSILKSESATCFLKSINYG